MRDLFKRRGTTLLSAIFIFAVSWTLASCSSDETPSENGESDVVEPDDLKDGEADSTDSLIDARTDSNGEVATDVTCSPNQIMGCIENNSPSIEKCGPEGEKIVQTMCPEGEVCRSGDCIEVFCVPGRRRCESGKQPQVCNESGEAFEEAESCGADEICEAGHCINRCQFASQEKSYIGCEYWGVELENHLLVESEESSEPIPDDRIPPYAIVLANTSDDYTANVSVLLDEGEYAEALGSRTVGADVRYPGTTFVEVYSEIVGEDGERIRGPIDGPVKNIELPQNSLMTLLFERRALPFGESTIDKVAYKVDSSQPVVAYQFNPFCCNYNYTNDASLLIPKNVMTSNYGFLGYSVWAGEPGSRLNDPLSQTLTVAATEDSTEVTVELPERVTENRTLRDVIYPFPVRLLGNEIQTRGDSGRIIDAQLDAFDALNIAARGTDPVADMTGAMIEANKPIAVFSGHSCTNTPFNMPACDHLESQLFPMETWGQGFIAGPLKIREENPTEYREGTYWKFLARTNGTSIKTGLDLSDTTNIYNPADENVPSCRQFSENPSSGTFQLDRGETCEFGTHEPFDIRANNPIQVGAFLSGQYSTTGEGAEFGTHNGDPAFFIVPPSEQYRRSYSFLTPSTYHQNYVSVTVNRGVDIQLDGNPIDISQYNPIQVQDSSEVVVHIPIDAGPHRIEATSQFGMVVYGFDDYVSYSYTGGLNLRKLSTLE